MHVVEKKLNQAHDGLAPSNVLLKELDGEWTIKYYYLRSSLIDAGVQPS
jgi:hypothetical protein